ncbi:MAG TPA: DUF3105 domain-containing protein [Candidatus Dormibacteraeota bacterium]|nr:DUF3105 domain-containing protein [Candidatus Dormibacteraeota bacterium]
MSRSQRDLKAMRQAQRDEAAARQKARDRRNLLIVGGALVLVALAIVVVAKILDNQAKLAQANKIKYQQVTTLVGQEVADEGTPNHIDPSTTWNYKFYPPTSGPHYSVQGSAPVNWQTIATLQDGQFVHNLEHGGIAILYNCTSGNDCTTLKTELENYVNNLAPAEPTYNRVKLVMTPYTRGMQKKIALVAWHYVDFLDSYDQNEITRFYESHVDKGPEQVP